MRNLIRKILKEIYSPTGFNQLKEELESIKGTPIYHFTTVDNALKILESNELRGTLPSGEYLSLDKRLAKTKHQMTISFTRDKNFKGDQSLAGQSKQPLDVILVLDRTKLKTRYKLEPFNYNSIDDDDFYKTKNKELEERVLNQKIYPVSNYLIGIIYKGNNPKIKKMLERYKP